MEIGKVKSGSAATSLRQRAEAQLKSSAAKTADSLKNHELQRHLHELQVHQIELEMQNNELRQIRCELETSLEKYTALYDFAPAAYFTLDRSGDIIDVNLAGASLIGGVRSRLIGRRFGTFLAVADRPAFSSFLDRVLTSLIKESCELVLIDKQEQQVIVQIEGMSTASGQEFRLALIDVTGRKGLENHLIQAEKMETVGLLAGGIARDINTILNMIARYGACSEMSMKADDPLRANLDQIIAAADRGANLTRSLLDFSRMQPVNPVPVDVNEIIRSMDSFLRMVIGEDLRLETACTEDALMVNADKSQLEQVIISLATNARHAMPEGGRLSILTEHINIDPEFIRLQGFGESGNYALIAVTDTGVGMDRDTVQSIFEPFFTTRVNGKGTGLGLSTAYSIIRMHQGFIKVVSEPAKGTTLRIYLPLVKTTRKGHPKT